MDFSLSSPSSAHPLAVSVGVPPPANQPRKLIYQCCTVGFTTRESQRLLQRGLRITESQNNRGQALSNRTQAPGVARSWYSSRERCWGRPSGWEGFSGSRHTTVTCPPRTQAILPAQHNELVHELRAGESSGRIHDDDALGQRRLPGGVHEDGFLVVVSFLAVLVLVLFLLLFVFIILFLFLFLFLLLFLFRFFPAAAPLPFLSSVVALSFALLPPRSPRHGPPPESRPSPSAKRRAQLTPARAADPRPSVHETSGGITAGGLLGAGA